MSRVSTIALRLDNPEETWSDDILGTEILDSKYVKRTTIWPPLRAHWRNSALQDFNDRDGWVSIVAGPDQPTWALIDGKIETNAKVRADRSLTIWVDATD